MSADKIAGIAGGQRQEEVREGGNRVAAGAANKPGAFTGSLRPWHFYLLAGSVVVAWIIFQLGWTTAHVFRATRFILGDQGSYLYVVDRWAAGEALYRDFAWQYGPLALAYYHAFAAIGGNTPLTLVVASSAAFAVAWILVTRLVIRVAGWSWGGVLALGGLLPVMSPSGIYTLNGPHGAIEMLLVVLCARRLASGRDAHLRAWQLGLGAGLLHWVRFGPHVTAMTAMVLITAWQYWRDGLRGRAGLRQLWDFVWRLVAGYGLVVLPLVFWIYWSRPPGGGWEQLWPAHMAAHYTATYVNRWPQFPSIMEFWSQWLPVLIGVGLTLFTLGSGFGRRAEIARPSDSDAVAGLMFFSLHYALGCLVLFHNDYAIKGHMWLAWPSVGLIALILPRWLRTIAALALVPAVWNALATHAELVKEERAWSTQALSLPNGQQLWFSKEEAKSFGELRAALGPEPRSRRLAVLLAGGGIHHFFGTQRVGRHWWFLPEFVRPWEEPVVWQALLKHDLILVADRGQVSGTQPSSGQSMVLWLPLPRTLAQQLPSHLANPRRIPGVGVMLEVVP